MGRTFLAIVLLFASQSIAARSSREYSLSSIVDGAQVAAIGRVVEGACVQGDCADGLRTYRIRCLESLVGRCEAFVRQTTVAALCVGCDYLFVSSATGGAAPTTWRLRIIGKGDGRRVIVRGFRADVLPVRQGQGETGDRHAYVSLCGIRGLLQKQPPGRSSAGCASD